MGEAEREQGAEVVEKEEVNGSSRRRQVSGKW
jgi:hypothetical protein